MRDFFRRLQINLEIFLLRILSGNIFSGIHVDRNKGFRRLNDQIPAGPQPDFLGQGFLNIAPDIVKRFQRRHTVVIQF